MEHHRRSKSILKNKSEQSRLLADPESERLLADNMSGSGISDNGISGVENLYICFINNFNSLMIFEILKPIDYF